ncbi:hypothetical protein FISHEDRAFT_12145, partial [Fistulina hepatica ATCC 64428]
EVLASLGQKWWTRSVQPDDLDLTVEQGMQNLNARENNDKILFNPSTTTEGHPANHFRIFIAKDDQYQVDGIPAIRATRRTTPPPIEAYTAGLMRRKEPVLRHKTESHLQLCRDAINTNQVSSPSNEAIWKSLSDDDLTNKQMIFLWKSMHDAFKTGGFWKHIPNFEDRGICPECGTEENLEHILLECEVPGQELIWDLAKTLVAKRNIQWPILSFGLIMA